MPCARPPLPACRQMTRTCPPVNTESGPRARRRLARVAPPVRWIHFAEIVVADVCIHVQQPPQRATFEQAWHLFHCRLEAAFMTDTQNATSLLARSDDAFGTSCGQGQRLLAEYMLAGGICGDSHFFVKQMGSYDRNGIDIGAGEQCLIVVNKIEFLLPQRKARPSSCRYRNPLRF